MHTTKITSSGIHTWPKLHIKKDAKWTLESKKNHTTTNNYISIKILPYIGISSINSVRIINP